MRQPGVRPGALEDLEALTAIYNHHVTTSACTFDLEPFTPEQRRKWIAHYGETGPHRLLVIEESGGIAGYTTSSPLRPKGAYATSVETTIYLAPGAVGKGLGTRLYTALFEALEKEPVHRAYAGIALPNPASVALHLRLGFASLGLYHEVGRKFGRYWSVEWYEKRLD